MQLCWEEFSTATTDLQAALMGAALAGHVQMARCLVFDLRVDASVANLDGETPLCAAASKGHLGVVRFLHTDVKVIVNQTGRWGRTPVHAAVESFKLEVLKYLVETAMADPNRFTQFGLAKTSPLDHAIGHCNNLAAVEYLLGPPAHIDPAAPTNLTHALSALHCAAAHNKPGMAKYLLNTHRLDINNANLVGRTSLLNAVEHGSNDVARILLDARADPTKGDKDKVFPLLGACLFGHFELVRMLCAKDRAGVSRAGRGGYTPLHAACESGHVEIARFLLEFADTGENAKDTRGLDPLSVAVFNRTLDHGLRSEIRQLFKEREARATSLRHRR